MKRAPFIVDNGSYPYETLVAIGCSDAEIITFLKRKRKYKLNDEERDAIRMRGKGRTVTLKCGAVMLRTTDIKDRVSFSAILAHEIFHAVYFVLDSCGLRLVDHSDEAFAYQIEYLTRKIHERL